MDLVKVLKHIALLLQAAVLVPPSLKSLQSTVRQLISGSIMQVLQRGRVWGGVLCG